jgi:hypothetical protein
MSLDRGKLNSYIHEMVAREQSEVGERGAHELLERGKQWKLADTLKRGGTILFPHAGLADCGHHMAAAVHACLDSGAEKVLVAGVLHALSDEMQDARVRVANGADPTQEKLWGIQGPGLNGREEWRNEFSLSHFLHLFAEEVKRRGLKKSPQMIVRYPYLAGGKPEKMPGIAELQKLVKDGAVVVTTADAFHHGIGYDDPPDRALYPERGGLDLARKTIAEGAAILGRGDYWGYNQHCVSAKSDGRDAGQVVRYLLGPLEGKILDLWYTDTTKMYDKPAPTWVAAALVEYRKV